MQPLPLELVTLLLAFYGALVSTVLAIREIRKEKRKVLVTCRMALTTNPVDRTDVWDFIEILAVNTGHRPVEIKMAGLSMSNGYVFTQMRSGLGRTPLPKKISDGESVSVLFDYPEVEKALSEQRVNTPSAVYKSAFVLDAEGNEYKSGMPRVLKDRKLAT